MTAFVTLVTEGNTIAIVNPFQVGIVSPYTNDQGMTVLNVQDVTLKVQGPYDMVLDVLTGNDRGKYHDKYIKPALKEGPRVLHTPS